MSAESRVGFYVMTGCMHHLVTQVYASQTKILEGGTKDAIRISKEALFKGVSTRFGLRTIEKYIENLDVIFYSSFQNRL